MLAMDFNRMDFASQTLQNNALFLKVKSSNKSPVGSFLVGRKNRYSSIPTMGNYGILPQNKLVVLDVDTHKGYSFDQQVKAFSKILDIDLNETFAVLTPSGGVHFYLFLPNHISFYKGKLPKASLRKYSKYFSKYSGFESFQADADIRTGATNSYVVGPGSFISEGSYDILNNKSIMVLPETGVNTLLKIVEEYQQDNDSTIKVKKERTSESEPTKRANREVKETFDSSVLKESDKIFSGSLVRYYERLIKTKGFTTFHAKRAFIVKATQCCYDLEDVSELCRILKINYDTYRNAAITDKQLYKDLLKIYDSPDDKYHGNHCPKAILNKGTQSYFMKDKVKEPPLVVRSLVKAKNSSRVRNRTIARSDALTRGVNPVVVDLEKVFKRITGGKNYRKKYPQQVKDSMKIISGLVQPLSNVGAFNIVLASSFLQETFSMSPSRVAQALRILRDKNILLVTNKQKTGLAATYMIAPTYVSDKLTKILRNTWASKTLVNIKGSVYKPHLFFDYESNTFRFALDSESVAFKFERNILKDQEFNRFYDSLNWSAEKASGYILKKYLKEESYWRNLADYTLVEDSINFFDLFQDTKESISEVFSTLRRKPSVNRLAKSIFDFLSTESQLTPFEKTHSISKQCSSSFV